MDDRLRQLQFLLFSEGLQSKEILAGDMETQLFRITVLFNYAKRLRFVLYLSCAHSIYHARLLFAASLE